MLALFAYLHAFVCSRHDLGLEILALRQQLSLLKRRHPRPRLNGIDRLFWITLRHLWSRWADALIVVKPETVIGWHRAGFRLYWRLRSRGGGRRIEGDVFDHDRRKILHSNVTSRPTAEWVVQQLREAFPYRVRHRYVIFDRNSKFSPEVIEFLKSSGVEAVRTSIRSPWQNGLAERWVGSCRRECFDHVIALNEAHVRRIAREYMAYYHGDRTHDGLGKDAPDTRAIETKPGETATLISLPRVGGLHHRYVWKAAA